jgi:hypothetical protein
MESDICLEQYLHVWRNSGNSDEIRLRETLDPSKPQKYVFEMTPGEWPKRG